MNQSQIALVNMFKVYGTDDYVPIETIMEKFPNWNEDLKVLLETGFIRPYAGEKYDPETDIMEQLKPGPKLTDKGQSLLMRSRFLY